MDGALVGAGSHKPMRCIERLVLVDSTYNVESFNGYVGCVRLNSFYLSFTMLERVILGNSRYTVERFTGKFGFNWSPTHEPRG